MYYALCLESCVVLDLEVELVLVSESSATLNSTSATFRCPCNVNGMLRCTLNRYIWLSAIIIAGVTFDVQMVFMVFMQCRIARLWRLPHPLLNESGNPCHSTKYSSSLFQQSSHTSVMHCSWYARWNGCLVKLMRARQDGRTKANTTVNPEQ